MIIKNFVKTNLEIAVPVVWQVPPPPPMMVKQPIKKKCGKAVASNGFWVSETKVDLLVTFFHFSYYSPFSADVVLSLSSFAMILIILKSRLFYGNPDVETAAAGQLNHECRE